MGFKLEQGHIVVHSKAPFRFSKKKTKTDFRILKQLEKLLITIKNKILRNLQLSKKSIPFKFSKKRRQKLIFGLIRLFNYINFLAVFIAWCILHHSVFFFSKILQFEIAIIESDFFSINLFFKITKVRFLGNFNFKNNKCSNNRPSWVNNLHASKSTKAQT